MYLLEYSTRTYNFTNHYIEHGDSYISMVVMCITIKWCPFFLMYFPEQVSGITEKMTYENTSNVEEKQQNIYLIDICW